MIKTLPFRSKAVWKGSLMLVSFFLFAACMQHDEGLAPQDLKNQDLLEVNSESGGKASMMQTTFTAHLIGANEFPSPVESAAQGQAIFKLSQDGMSIEYRLNVANIENMTMAHIHCGAVDERGSPLVWLFGGAAPVTSRHGNSIAGLITAADFKPLPDQVNVCAGGSPDFANLIERLRNGTTYVNVHTNVNPGGEIRGQIQ